MIIIEIEVIILNRLKSLRNDLNVTQKELASFLGINQNTYSYWENGKVKIDSDSLSKLSNYFDVSIDYILGISDQKKEDGVKTPSSENNISPSLQKLYEVASELSEEQIQDVLDYIQFKKYQQEKR